MIKYDAAVIQEFADRLYKRAKGVALSFTLIGILFGLGAGFYFNRLGDFGDIALIVGAVLGSIIGYVIGQERAFALKLQAQLALAQMKIEENTRSNKS